MKDLVIIAAVAGTVWYLITRLPDGSPAVVPASQGGPPQIAVGEPNPATPQRPSQPWWSFGDGGGYGDGIDGPGGVAAPREVQWNWDTWMWMSGFGEDPSPSYRDEYPYAPGVIHV